MTHTQTQESIPMYYTTIPNTILKPSAICLGTADIGSKIDRATSFRMLDAYREQGGNFLDSAEVYANWLPGEQNISEKTIGQWLTTRTPSEEVPLRQWFSLIARSITVQDC